MIGIISLYHSYVRLNVGGADMFHVRRVYLPGSEKMATLKGGYDFDFVESPPKRLECTICLLVVRDPHVISCCGNQFCRPCLERVQRDKKPCPLCNASDYTAFFHKGVTREVNDLHVHCPQKEVGCLWEGELGELVQHLEDGRRGCGFVEVECAFKCGGRFLRSAIGEHESKDCPSRPVEVVMADILKKLDELSAENQAIKEENQAIKDENKVIKEENEHLKNQMTATRAQVTQLEDSIAGVSRHTDEEFRQLKSGLADEVERGRVGLEATANVLKDYIATKGEFARLKTEFTELKDRVETLSSPRPVYVGGPRGQRGWGPRGGCHERGHRGGHGRWRGESF